MHTDLKGHSYTADSVLDMKQISGHTTAVVIPALNEESTVGGIVSMIRSKLMDEIPLIDELIVMDGGSSDRTSEISREAGAQVFQVLHGPGGEIPGGKGSALWRSLFYVKSSIIIYIDADIENFGTHFVTSLLVPFFQNPQIGYVKGFYDRPISADGVLHSSGGGRVTELLVRPLFSRFFPEAAELIQPLAGEYGFQTELARSLVFYSGYGVETSLTLDFIQKYGADRMAQVDLGVRIHRNRPLSELSRMAAVILQTFADFADEKGIFSTGGRGEDQYIAVSADSKSVEKLEQVRLPLANEVVYDLS